MFDDIEEGGIRGSSSYTSHEIDEHENDNAMDGLQDRVLMLKRVSSIYAWVGPYFIIASVDFINFCSVRLTLILSVLVLEYMHPHPPAPLKKKRKKEKKVEKSFLIFFYFLVVGQVLGCWGYILFGATV